MSSLRLPAYAFRTAVTEYFQIFYNDYLSIYNACYGFCYGTTLVTPPNGQAFTNMLRSKAFEGRLGPVLLDAGANSIQAFTFQTLQNGNFVTLVTRIICVCTSKQASLGVGQSIEFFLQRSRMHLCGVGSTRIYNVEGYFKNADHPLYLFKQLHKLRGRVHCLGRYRIDKPCCVNNLPQSTAVSV